MAIQFLLDTNVCIALINGSPASVRNRFDKELGGGARIHVSSIAAFELWYGAAKSSRPDFNRKRLLAFFSGPIELAEFGKEDAQAAGMIRAELEAAGRPIGAYDLLIAGQAIRNQFTLVTSNQREFSRVKRLTWEDWAKPRT